MVTTLACAMILLTVGCQCSQPLDDCKAQNRIQQQRIADLEGELAMCNTDLQQKMQQLQGLSGQTGADIEAKNAMIAALEADLEKKKALIAKMQTQLMQAGAPLPPEMNILLQDFAKTSDMIDFDAATGMLKFKSDLLFDPGSDSVKAAAAESIKTLAGIMGSAEAKQFDIVVVGHTDDVPIKRAQTLRAHPSNWHLSVHRAISVENLLSKGGIAPERMAIKGYGEYRPVAPNKPNKGGNEANRRVEIFIIPASS